MSFALGNCDWNGNMGWELKQLWERVCGKLEVDDIWKFEKFWKNVKAFTFVETKVGLRIIHINSKVVVRWRWKICLEISEMSLVELAFVGEIKT